MAVFIFNVSQFLWEPCTVYTYLSISEPQSDPTRSIVVIRVNFFQTELMVEICLVSLIRAIGKVLLMKFS